MDAGFEEWMRKERKKSLSEGSDRHLCCSTEYTLLR
jgi:hypothetical protein